MRRAISLSLATAAMATFALVPATASASVVVSPTSVAFPDQAVGSKGAPVAVTLTKNCAGAEDTQCFATPGGEGPTFNTSISVSAGFGQTNDCPATLTAVFGGNQTPSCTINVFFSPDAKGAATGTLSTGSGGPTVSLSGTGLKAKKCKKKGKKSDAAAAKKNKCTKKGKK